MLYITYVLNAANEMTVPWKVTWPSRLCTALELTGKDGKITITSARIATSSSSANSLMKVFVFFVEYIHNRKKKIKIKNYTRRKSHGGECTKEVSPFLDHQVLLKQKIKSTRQPWAWNRHEQNERRTCARNIWTPRAFHGIFKGAGL